MIEFELGMMGSWTPLPLIEAAREVIAARDRQNLFDIPIPLYNAITELSVAISAIDRGIRAPDPTPQST